MDAMKDFLIRWLVLTVAAAVMVVLLPGMTAVGQPPILGIAVFALFMALINASIKPVTQLIALPFSILTFGLLYLVINWLFMRLAVVPEKLRTLDHGRITPEFLRTFGFRP